MPPPARPRRAGRRRGPGSAAAPGRSGATPWPTPGCGRPGRRRRPGRGWPGSGPRSPGRRRPGVQLQHEAALVEDVEAAQAVGVDPPGEERGPDRQRGAEAELTDAALMGVPLLHSVVGDAGGRGGGRDLRPPDRTVRRRQEPHDVGPAQGVADHDRPRSQLEPRCRWAGRPTASSAASPTAIASDLRRAWRGWTGIPSPRRRIATLRAVVPAHSRPGRRWRAPDHGQAGSTAARGAWKGCGCRSGATGPAGRPSGRGAPCGWRRCSCG